MNRTARVGLLCLACASLLSACNEPPAPETQSTPPPPPISRAPEVALPAPVGPASADAAKTARDSPDTDPKGTLSKQEETLSMPMAGHGNNHSSPSLEPPAKR